MNNILSITSNAVDQIRNIISSSTEDIDSVVVGVDKTGCSGYSYKLELANSNNIKNHDKIDKDGVTIFIDPKATMFLIGSTMDYKIDKLSSRFVFNNPNEKSTCGCGESFSI